MSQKKVDAYKARKGLHNKTDRKEKVLFGLEMFAWAFICVVIVAWIGYSAYVKVTGAKENVVQNTVMDTTALDNYISNLSTDASDGTDSTDADTAEEEDTTASTDTDSEDADAADTTADDSETETADKSEEADDTNGCIFKGRAIACTVGSNCCTIVCDLPNIFASVVIEAN